MGGEREAGRNFDGFFFLRFPLSAAAGGRNVFPPLSLPSPPFWETTFGSVEEEKKYRKFN